MDDTLKTGSINHILTVDIEGGIARPSNGNEGTSSHTWTNSLSWQRSKSSYLPVRKEGGEIVLACHRESGWDWLVLTKGYILRITVVSYMEKKHTLMWSIEESKVSCTWKKGRYKCENYVKGSAVYYGTSEVMWYSICH